MKKVVISFAVLALAAGCAANKKDSAAAKNNPLDVPPGPTMSALPPVNVPSTPPVVTEQPTATAASDAPVAGKKYTVKRGDTPWNIAQRAYGDGKQNTKILAANGLKSPQDLKAGATITVP